MDADAVQLCTARCQIPEHIYYTTAEFEALHCWNGPRPFSRSTNLVTVYCSCLEHPTPMCGQYWL